MSSSIYTELMEPKKSRWLIDVIRYVLRFQNFSLICKELLILWHLSLLCVVFWNLTNSCKVTQTIVIIEISGWLIPVLIITPKRALLNTSPKRKEKWERSVSRSQSLNKHRRSTQGKQNGTLSLLKFKHSLTFQANESREVNRGER